MSTSNLYRVYKTKATEIAEYRNGWGSAPLIWGYLCHAFLGRERYQWGLGSGAGTDSKLWELAYDDRVPRAVRLAHAFTFDRSVCPPEKTAELADALEEAGRICSHEQHVNHWSAIAADLRAHKHRAREIGVALSCTSVSDPWSGWQGAQPGKSLWNVFSVLECSPSPTPAGRDDG